MFHNLANSERTRFLGVGAALLLGAAAAVWMAVDLGRQADPSCALGGRAGAVCRRVAVSQTPPENCKYLGKAGTVCGDYKE